MWVQVTCNCVVQSTFPCNYTSVGLPGGRCVGLEQGLITWQHSHDKYIGLLQKRLNSLWPSDAIWQHRSGSTIAQVMACCLTGSSHYPNQCWLIISKDLWGNLTRDTQTINYYNLLSKISSKSPRAQKFISYVHYQWICVLFVQTHQYTRKNSNHTVGLYILPYLFNMRTTYDSPT